MREEECWLIVEEFPSKNQAFFRYKGRNKNNQPNCQCKANDSYRWWNLYRDHIEIGDTIIKRKGELDFNIHKKDTVLSFNWECDGQMYK